MKLREILSSPHASLKLFITIFEQIVKALKLSEILINLDETQSLNTKLIEVDYI